MGFKQQARTVEVDLATEVRASSFRDHFIIMTDHTQGQSILYLCTFVEVTDRLTDSPAWSRTVLYSASLRL